MVCVKTCFKCGQEKPIDGFYKHPQMADGRLNKCKECTKVDVSEHYKANRIKYAAYEKKRFKDPNRKEKVAVYQRTQRKKHPIKNIARRAVKRAVDSGKIIKPLCCTSCGSQGRIEAHHHDYSKPLDVQWLCFACHRIYGHGQTVTTDKF